MDYKGRKELEQEMRFINHCLRKQKLSNYLNIMKEIDTQSLFRGYHKANQQMLESLDLIDSSNLSVLPKIASELRKSCEFQLDLEMKIRSAFDSQESMQKGSLSSFFSDYDLIPTISCEDVGFLDYCEDTGLKIEDEEEDEESREEAGREEDEEEIDE